VDVGLLGCVLQCCCCSVLQCVAVWCSVVQCVAVCCSVLLLQCSVVMKELAGNLVEFGCCMYFFVLPLQCVAGRCSVFAVCYGCRVLQS